MAEATKVRLYKIASELNIGKDEIIEYLTKVGKPAKNHMAILTDEQLDAISSHFKKDKEVADKHKKKVETFRATRTKKKETVPEKETVAETAKKKEKAVSAKTVKEAEPVAAVEEVTPPVVEEIPSVVNQPEVLEPVEAGETEEVSAPPAAEPV